MAYDFLRRPIGERAVKATTGRGAFAMTYDSPISSGRWDTPAGMKRAQALSHTNPWIAKSERLVTGRASSLPWHLEDGDDATVDDEARPELRAIRDLLERPSPITRPTVTWRQLTGITYRHMGVCNVGAWYLDSLDGNGIPREILYLNPARLTPDDRSGTLRGWLLDADQGNGTRLDLDEVVLFVLSPPDQGYFGRGLVEEAESKAILQRAADRYATHTFQSGGRRGSWVGPREGRLPDDVFDSLVANIRNVREAHDSAKRDIVVKAPIDVVPQAATAQELQAAAIMEMSRDDILVMWGIDVADAGIPGAAGLSSGQMRAQARQSTFENGIEPRVDVFTETVQYQLLDRWKALGLTVELEIEKPQFEDEKPAFERAQIAQVLPLRNKERRAIVGLDPFDDPALDNAVWMPVGIAEAFMAPDEVTGVTVSEAPVPQLLPGKASILGRTRDAVERRVTPALRKSVAAVLRDQRAEVLRLIRAKAAHLAAKPTDTHAFWVEGRWNKALADALRPHKVGVVQTVATETKRSIGHLNPAKADPSFLDAVTAFVLDRGGERVVEINQTTRDAIVAAIREVVGEASGEGALDIAARLTDKVGGLTVWDEARAEMIARTETMFAYNDAALGSFREYGVGRVEAIDGEGDPECAERNGRTFTVDEALGIADHPNGTLDWVPVI